MLGLSYVLGVMRRRNGQFNPKRKMLKVTEDPFCEEVIQQWRLRSELVKS